MARINLLPWRAERRKQRQKEFMTMLALSAAAGVVLWFLINTYYNNQISGQINMMDAVRKMTLLPARRLEAVDPAMKRTYAGAPQGTEHSRWVKKDMVKSQPSSLNSQA